MKSRSQRYVVTLMAVLLSGCGKDGTGSPAAAALASATDVVTIEAKLEPLATSLEAVGTARAKESIEVKSRTSNIITAIAFHEDSLVHAGQVLVELNAAEERAALAEAEAVLIDSQSQFNRSRSLYTQQALSASQLEQIEAALNTSKARLDAAKAKLADATIRAGFDGRTGLRLVSVGSLVSAGTVITTLDDSSTIKLEFSVPEAHLYLLRRGQAVVATPAGLPDARFIGKVTMLDSRIDPATRSIIVRAEIPNSDGRLRPGMFMTVLLEGDPTPALLVPEAAIVPEQGHTYVFAAVGGKVERREVRTGRRRKGEVEVLSGLTRGEHVVTEGTQMLRDGDKVREVPQNTTRAAGL